VLGTLRLFEFKGRRLGSLIWGLQNAPLLLVQLDGVAQRLEVAFAEALEADAGHEWTPRGGVPSGPPHR